jgi:hypothetical protein
MNPETTQQEPNSATHVEISDPTAGGSATTEATETKRKSTKSRSRRIGSSKKNNKTDKGFAVPMGDSGETFDSVWQFGE